MIYIINDLVVLFFNLFFEINLDYRNLERERELFFRRSQT